MKAELIDGTLPAQSGGIKTEFHLLVHSVSRLQRTLFDRCFKALNVTRAQWWVLKILASTQNTLNQTELADLLATGKGGVGKLIAKMEAAKLLSRATNSNDQRAQHIAMLPAGRKVLESSINIESDLATKICQDIDRPLLDTASEVLRTAKLNIYRKNIGSEKTRAPNNLIKKIESVEGQTEPNWVGFQVHDVSRMRQRIVDRLLQPIGLTRSQWRVLSFLTERDGMTQTSLANKLDLSRSALGTLIIKLEGNQLVVRLPDPEDSRRNRVILTKAGNSLVRSIRSTTAQAEDFVLSGIDEEDIKTTIDVLKKMKSNISEMLDSTA